MAYTSTKLVAKTSVADNVDDQSGPGVHNVTAANKEGHKAMQSKQLKLDFSAPVNQILEVHQVCQLCKCLIN